MALDFRNNSDTSIHLVDLETGDTRELTPHEDEGIFVPGPWAPDGSGFYLITDAEQRVSRAGVLRPRIGPTTSGWRSRRWTSTTCRMSADGRVLAWIVNDQGYDRLRLRDLETGEDLPEPDLPSGRRPHLTGAEPPLALSPDGSHAALISASPRRPPEAWVVETATGKARP